MGKNKIPETGIYDARQLGRGRMLLLGFQHMFAMFGATILVPILTGLDVSNTLLFAGLGTLLFHLITGRKVPAFLGSSFAFLGAYGLVTASGQDIPLTYSCFGVAVAGLVYLVLALFFKLFGAVRHAGDKIGIGTYELNTDMDYNALIQGMSNRNATINADTVTVTIPEGYSVRQIVSLLAKYGINSEDALLSAAERGSFDYSFLDSGKSGIAKLEGYLFPDTYEFFVNEDPSHAICRLLDNFSQRMDDELMTQVEESGYSLEEILIIASLIEKETDGKDRTNIASVIYNRLNNVGETYHKLEIDAAVIYGLGYANGENYAGPLTQADLDKDTPYNLRMHEGLPPTPICNPGLASIRAALEPADTNYYFYALGKDGVHHFFKTYREHVNFVNSSQYGG